MLVVLYNQVVVIVVLKLNNLRLLYCVLFERMSCMLFYIQINLLEFTAVRELASTCEN